MNKPPNDFIDAESRAFYRNLRRACRSVYQEDGLEPEMAAIFGDALALYQVVGGLNFKAARALAQGGYWYPNDIIKATDSDLLELKGIGKAGVVQIRSIYNTIDKQNLSVTQFMDALTEEKDTLIPYDVPTRAELQNAQSA